MSSFTQFFPNSGQQNIGGGSIPVEILGIAGGGGGGTGMCVASCWSGGGGDGGDGGLFHAYNYYIKPGVTYPITIGAGGAGGVSGGRDGAPIIGRIEDMGDPGGATVFGNPECQLRAEGGGGGGAAIDCCYVTEVPGAPGTFSLNSRGPTASNLWCYRCGQPGGNGGGAGAANCINYAIYPLSSNQSWCPATYYNETEAGFGYGNIKAYEVQSTYNSYPQVTCGSFYDNVITAGEAVTCPWGTLRGFPGTSVALVQCCGAPLYWQVCGGKGGHNSGNAVQMLGAYYPCVYSYANVKFANDCAYYTSSITGCSVQYGKCRGAGGCGCPTGPSVPISCCCYGIGNGGNGCSGVLIIKYPSAYGAAVSFPGATNISPSTPGYYTYCFTSSGFITLP